MTQEIEPHAAGWCVHFNGIQKKFCKLEVEYDSVCDDSSRPYKWPCILSQDAKTSCAYLRRPTPEEIALSEKQTQEVLAGFFKDMSAGACPHCKKVLTSERQVGRSVYGSCGCRLWQGTARSVKKLRELQEQV